MNSHPDMGEIIILPFTGLDERYLEDLHYRLDAAFPQAVQISTTTLDPAFAYYPQRGQYFSTRILEKLAEMSKGSKVGTKILGLTTVDLFIPILTYVFGESLLDGPAAVVSMYRLDPEMYGLHANTRLLMDRLEKVSIHELGHGFGLKHCQDYRCVMHSSNVVQGVDFKGRTFCGDCGGKLGFKMDGGK